MSAIPESAGLPIDWPDICEQLTQSAIDLAGYFEKTTNKSNKKELYEILGRLAEISYSVLGNGIYLREKGHIKT
jgi:hypothetical protein